MDVFLLTNCKEESKKVEVVISNFKLSIVPTFFKQRVIGRNEGRWILPTMASENDLWLHVFRYGM